jgi:hypothetical protein
MHESYQPVAGLLSELTILTDFKVILLEFLARQACCRQFVPIGSKGKQIAMFECRIIATC